MHQNKRLLKCLKRFFILNVAEVAWEIISYDDNDGPTDVFNITIEMVMSRREKKLLKGASSSKRFEDNISLQRRTEE